MEQTPDVQHTIDLTSLTLDELGRIVMAEQSAAARHLVGALGHFIQMGEVLLVARAECERQNVQWIRWLRSVGIEHHFTADRAMRLAHYREHLPESAFMVRTDAAGRTLNPSWNHALLYLRGLPAVHSKSGTTTKYGEDLVAEARRLHATGLSYRKVSDAIGVPATTVRLWCDSEAKKKLLTANRHHKERAKRAATALRKQEQRDERDRLARRTGGEVAVAYANLRKAVAALDRAATSELDAELCSVLRRAIGQCHSAENSIVDAMKLDRGRGAAAA